MLTLKRMISSIIMVILGFLFFYPLYYLDIFISKYNFFPLFVPFIVAFVIVSIKSAVLIFYSKIMGGNDLQDAFIPAIAFSIGIIIMYFLNNIFVLNVLLNNISIFIDILFILQQTSIIAFSLTLHNKNKKIIYLGYFIGITIHFFCKFSKIFFLKT